MSIWKVDEQKGNGRVLWNNTYIIYTVSFFVLLLIVFFPFLREGKSFVWNVDGINQHYPMLWYYGRLLRGIFEGNGFPWIDFNLGLGFDTITTLHYYVLGDPIALFSIGMTPDNAVYVYNGLILLRLYLIGIGFIILLKYWKKEGLGVIIGALIYVFCGYVFYAGVRHPFFLNPMIYLPILLIGIEQVLRGKKPYLLIIMSFISTVSNFYFFYIVSVIVVIYVIVRYVIRYHRNYKNYFTGFLLTGLKTGGYYLLGILMASVIFLPVIYAFLNNGRYDSSPEMTISYLRYHKKYYIRLFQSVFATGVSPGYWVQLTFSSVLGASLAILFCNKKYRQLQLVTVMCFVALSVPAFGSFMNGFSYITNRWSFLISLLAAMIFAITYEKFYHLERKEKVLLIIGTIGYGILTFLFPTTKTVKIEFFVLCIIIGIVFLLQMNWFHHRTKIRDFILYAMVLLTLGFHGYAYYAKEFHGYVNEFLSKEEVDQLTTKGALTFIPEILDDSFYRIETYGDNVRNEALRMGFNDTSGYFSLLDGNVTTYFKQLELLNQRNAYRFDNLDNRTILDALAGVKYVVSTDKTTAPYGYKLRKEKQIESDTYYLFENKYALPLGYTYQQYMLEEDYNQLSSLEKQNAMMQAIILEEEIPGITRAKQDMSVGLEQVHGTIYPDENVILEDNTIKVLKPGATILIEFSPKPKTETYLRFENFHVKKNRSTMTSFKTKGEKEVTKNVNVRNSYHNTYFGKDNYLINTGYSKNGISWVKLTFPTKESYRYDDLQLYRLTMDHYKDQVIGLKKHSLQNIRQKRNRIKGDIVLDQDKIMLLSIPYSPGWNAYVDGEKVEILRANIMHMAIPIEAGAHEISLHYRTPYLREGLLITILSSMVLIGLICMDYMNSKKEKETN